MSMQTLQDFQSAARENGFVETGESESGSALWFRNSTPDAGSQVHKRLCLDSLTKPDSSQLLIFDQFEEILTADPTDIECKEAFFDQLAEPFSGEELFDSLTDLVYFLKNARGQYKHSIRMAIDRHLEACVYCARVTNLDGQDLPSPLLRDHLGPVPTLDAGPVPEDRNGRRTRDEFLEELESLRSRFRGFLWPTAARQASQPGLGAPRICLRGCGSLSR